MPTHRCPVCGDTYEALGGGTCDRCHGMPDTSGWNNNTLLIAVCVVLTVFVIGLYVALLAH